MPDDDDRYAPSIFMSDYEKPDSSTLVNQPLPRGTEGGIIEGVKRALVTAVREAFTGHGMTVHDTTVKEGAGAPKGPQPVCVDLEYPHKEVHYPGVWVQFSPSSMVRAGIDHEVEVPEDDGSWSLVQEWEVRGRATLTIVALNNKQRDRLADTVFSMLAYSRPPDRTVTDPSRDTKQHRALKAALAENPYVSLSANTDQLFPSGQQTNVGAPWAPDILVYEDGYGFDLLGNCNVKFRHDGAYELSRIDVVPSIVDDVPFPHALNPRYEARSWHSL